MIAILFICCLLVLLQLQITSSFQLPQSSRRIIPATPKTSQIHHYNSVTNAGSSSAVVLHGTIKEDDEGDFEKVGSGDSYEGDIDWDAEWKKVVENREQPSTRPGKYKNDVERALLQTTKATGEQIKKVKIVKPDINIRSLQGDARVGRLNLFLS